MRLTASTVLQAASKSAAAAARAAQALADLEARETAVLERAQGGAGAAAVAHPDRNNFQCNRCRKVRTWACDGRHRQLEEGCSCV